MSLEYRLTRRGIELTEAQLEDCRTYACAEVLARHQDEFKEACQRHYARTLGRIKAELGMPTKTP